MTEQTPEERVAAIKARAEAATEGPWVVERGRIRQYSPKHGITIHDVIPLVSAVGNGPADASFAAHAREDIPWLIEGFRWHAEQEAGLRDDVAELEAEVATLRQQHEADVKYQQWLETDLATLRQQCTDKVFAIAARDAVIAKALDFPSDDVKYDGGTLGIRMRKILSTAPADVLAQHDAEVAATALEKAAEDVLGPSECLRDAATCRDVAQSLCARAAEIREENT